LVLQNDHSQVLTPQFGPFELLPLFKPQEKQFLNNEEATLAADGRFAAQSKYFFGGGLKKLEQSQLVVFFIKSKTYPPPPKTVW
jgi:hypothetical protein